MIKFSNYLCLLAVALILNCKISLATNITGLANDPVTSHAILDDKGRFNISWEVDNAKELITFEVDAATNGYVGFGLFPTGSMEGADIFYAGVWDNGSSYHVVKGHDLLNI